MAWRRRAPLRPSLLSLAFHGSEIEPPDSLMLVGASDSFPRLVGDIGGTNARFAMQFGPSDRLSEPRTLASADHRNLREAVEHYLRETDAPRPRWAAFGIANPVIGGHVTMTNHHWSFSVNDLKQDLGLARLLVLNDFAALALAIPHLAASDIAKIGGGAPRVGTPIGLIGPGTGLGVSGLVPCDRDYAPLHGEGGHVTIAAFDEREAMIIAQLRLRYSHVSAERVLSGPGLVDLYDVCSNRAGTSAEPLTAVEICARAVTGNCSLCVEVLETFCAMLGTVAANLALVLGALGGIYVGGGIVPKLGVFFARSPFRSRFELKGRFSSYLAQIPTYVIHAQYPGLLGAAFALDRSDAGPGLD